MRNDRFWRRAGEESLLPVSSGQKLLAAAVDDFVLWVTDINGRTIEYVVTDYEFFYGPKTVS
jgi:hypothetical protein